MGLGPRDDNDLEDGMKGWRGKCYGLAFRPVPLGPPCKAVSGKDGNCLFRAISYALCRDAGVSPTSDGSERDNAGARRGVVQPFNPWVDEDQSDREARRSPGAPRNQHEPHAFTHAAGEEDTDIEIHWVHILHSWKKFLEWLGDRWWGDARSTRSHALKSTHGTERHDFLEPREPSRLRCAVFYRLEGREG
ncbi:hypothetical protein Q5P01_000424 [Channa striata]|uniref:OTU domain-containing protein n=1 Tax=Channa striata TaxID=64152 RepID=A0AA88LMP9_CHASR|nr:hypothetical protein Q5P01_000424 [Channa striata]